MSYQSVTQQSNSVIETPLMGKILTALFKMVLPQDINKLSLISLLIMLKKIKIIQIKVEIIKNHVSVTSHAI